ncbi:MAG: YdcF family protein [Minwuiales bacterium]|nr:YdcF family protein [Minwuiales bacterium]
MTFVLSKILGMLAQPSNLLLVGLVLGFVICLTRWRRLGLWLVGLSILAGVTVSVLPVGRWLIGPLENRFPQVGLSEAPDGIVVLGGSFSALLTEERGQIALNETTERLTEFLTLARRFPETRLVFTGGSGAINRIGPLEAEMAADLFADLGLDPARVTFEAKSRNTFENALYTKELVNPQAGETWLLVTSANHMPRAVGSFRTAGWSVLPYPVDYRTTTGQHWRFRLSFSGGLKGLDRAAHEWYGLIAYRILGRTDRLFPGPDNAGGE